MYSIYFNLLAIQSWLSCFQAGVPAPFVLETLLTPSPLTCEREQALGSGLGPGIPTGRLQHPTSSITNTSISLTAQSEPTLEKSGQLSYPVSSAG